ncbi:MAG: hypothetical protein OC190_14730 [Novosphingobium aromaticivorans]|nr:hypothetical protein [Novosphingobium aromaticivorans]
MTTPDSKNSRPSYFIGVLGVPVFKARILRAFAGTPALAKRCSPVFLDAGINPAPLFKLTKVQKKSRLERISPENTTDKKQNRHMQNRLDDLHFLIRQRPSPLYAHP